MRLLYQERPKKVPIATLIFERQKTTDFIKYETTLFRILTNENLNERICREFLEIDRGQDFYISYEIEATFLEVGNLFLSLLLLAAVMFVLSPTF